MMNLLWIHGLSCNGNTQSFLCAESYLMETFLKSVNILFHPSLSPEENLEEVVKDILEGKKKLDILVVEGAFGKRTYKLLGEPLETVIKRLAKLSEFVIALGNCAVFGNIPALLDKDIKGLQFRFRERGGILGSDFRSGSGYPVINISGCPAHPEWFIVTVLNIVHGRKIKLDEYGRPKEFYAYYTHNGCIRNEYFEWKVEAEELGRKEGCLFYRFGCRGPMTKSSCNRIMWNGVSSKTRSGQPCFGCTEFDFPKENMWETKYNMGIPAELPPDVSLRGYIMLSGIAKTFTPSRLKKRLIDEDN